MFVAFMGTKLRGDLITNARVYQELLWGNQHFERVMSFPSPCWGHSYFSYTLDFTHLRPYMPGQCHPSEALQEGVITTLMTDCFALRAGSASSPHRVCAAGSQRPHPVLVENRSAKGEATHFLRYSLLINLSSRLHHL